MSTKAVALLKSKKKRREPPKPPQPPTWRTMMLLLSSAVVYWTMTDTINFWQWYMLGIPVSLLEYFASAHYHRASLWAGRPFWLMALVSLLSWPVEIILSAIELVRDINYWWES